MMTHDIAWRIAEESSNFGEPKDQVKASQVVQQYVDNYTQCRDSRESLQKKFSAI